MSGRLVLGFWLFMVVLAGGFRKEGSLAIHRNRINVLRFACGVNGENGEVLPDDQRGYQYNFSGQPQWMLVKDNSI